MYNVDKLVALIKQIIPNKSSKDSISDYFRNFVQENVNQMDELFVPIQPQEVHQGGMYSSQKIKSNKGYNPQKGEPYATFKKMRELGGYVETYGGFYSINADLFCRQAEFMKDFTDNYDQKIPFDTCYIIYGKMDDAQLRTYFTWRTKMRQGIAEKTSPSYVLCYTFELLNDIGTANPAETIEKLLAIWTIYRQYDANLDKYFCEWIRDYYVVHHTELMTAFSEYRSRFPVPFYGEDFELLAKAITCSWDSLKVIEASSSFKISNGQFYKSGNQQIIEKCTCFVVHEIAKLFKSGGVNFKKMFIENLYEDIINLFYYAIHPSVKMQLVTIRLDEFETMKMNSYGWRRIYICITKYCSAIGYILKCIEVKMRQHFACRWKLQLPNISVVENCFLNSEIEKFGWVENQTLAKLQVWKRKAYALINSAGFLDAIEKAIANFCTLEHIFIQAGVIKIVKPIEIDMSKLENIKREHYETAKRLIFEEQQIPADDPPILKPAVVVSVCELKGIENLIVSLSDEGRALLLTLLTEGKVPPNSELLIETINEKALEAISDNLIDYAEGTPYVYDDYIDELKSSLGGQ